jgi:hypothetical protein
MSAVGDQLGALKAVREECQNSIRSLDDQERTIDRYFTQNAQAIGSMAEASYDSARQSLERLSRIQAERPPDWPRIRQVLSGTVEEFAIARNQAERDVQAYQQLSTEFDRVRQTADRVRAFLAGHEEDRLAANQHYQNAEDSLRRAQAESSNSGREWARLLEMVRGAAADLAHAERLAQEDIRLAGQAEAEIQQAAVTLNNARSYYAMGVTVSTMGAEAQLAEADRLYRSQDYEQAIRAAAAAVQQIRHAHAQAAQEASMRQMTIEANRRRMAMGPADAAVLSAGSMMAAGAPAMQTRLAAPGRARLRRAAGEHQRRHHWQRTE